MRGTTLGLLGASLLCFSGGAGASSIVYNVNISDGTETVFGTITTDGVVGALAPSDVTAWSLMETGPVAFGLDSSGGPYPWVGCGASVPGVGCGITATPQQLLFTSPQTAGMPFRLNLGNFVGGDINDENALIFFTGGIAVSQDRFAVNEVDYTIVSPSPYTIGTAVPEPATLSLLGLGLAGVGFMRRRKAA